jgi:hypothetical protein
MIPRQPVLEIVRVDAPKSISQLAKRKEGRKKGKKETAERLRHQRVNAYKFGWSEASCCCC